MYQTFYGPNFGPTLILIIKRTINGFPLSVFDFYEHCVFLSYPKGSGHFTTNFVK